MACSTDCELNGIRYIFNVTEIDYQTALQTCQTSQGGQIAFANTDIIRNKLYNCCKNDQEFWVAFTKNDLTKTEGNECPLFKARENNKQFTSTCNSNRKYVCELPQVTTTTPTVPQVLTSKSNTSSLLTTVPALTAASQLNVGLIIGAVFAVILLLLLLVALYHFRLRHLNTKKYSKADFKKCMLGCAGSKNPPSDQPAVVPQEDHGYYSIRVQEERSGANSVYSYITEPGNARSTATTPDLRTQHQIAPKVPGFPAPEAPGHYETIDQDIPQQDTAPNRIIPPPPKEAPPPTPGSEPKDVGSGVTYTTLVVPDESISYTTITRVLGDAPADPYAVVHKDSVNSRK